MREELEKRLKNCILWNDFYSSFKHLPNPLQVRVIARIETLIQEVETDPNAVVKYDRDMASVSKYFPKQQSEILEKEKFMPFRTVRLSDGLNKDIVTINFLSCLLIKKFDLESIICEGFCKKINDNLNCSNHEKRIILLSCFYRSFDSNW